MISIATIYTVHLNQNHDQEIFRQVLKHLPDDVRNQAARYRAKRDAIRWTASDVLKRIVACRTNDMNIHSVEFLRDGFGKPSLRGFPDFHFNVSHSEDWLVCAVSGEGPVGVDIEKVTKAEPEVAQICFTSSELAEWNKRPERQKDDFFFELWTLKECYVKAIGKGLSIDLSSFEMIRNQDTIYISLQGAIDPERYMRVLPFDADYKLAVCLPNKDTGVNFQNLALDEMMIHLMELIDREP